MPSFNYSRYLSLAINGVLSQSYSDFELIIVDDCSTDGSREIAEEYRRTDDRVRLVFHEENRGLSATRNTGLAESSGEFIALCDADDIWLPHKLSAQLQAFQANPQIGLVHSDASIVDGEGFLTGQNFSQLFQRKGQRTSGFLFGELCKRNFICVPTVLLRRQALMYANGFDERLRSLEDWVCWTKVSRRYGFKYLDEALVRYRMHRGSLSQNSQGMARNRITAIGCLLETLGEISPQELSSMLYSLGMSHLELGELQGAAAAFSKSLATYPLQLRGLIRFCQASIRSALSQHSA
jgi:glycosyltransferase involved in cell wall biosynthesis